MKALGGGQKCSAGDTLGKLQCPHGEYMKSLIDEILAKEKVIRYVAILQNNTLVSQQRDNIVSASSSDSDKYEELLVNPAMLTLATQRGNIDCGGLRFLLVRYGNFYQWVSPFKSGHISVCIDANADPMDVINRIESLIGAHQVEVDLVN